MVGIALGAVLVRLSPAQTPSRVDPEVLQEIQAHGQARVIVTLTDQSLALRTQQIAQRIEGILRELTSQDFQLSRRFESVAAFAGVVTPSGIAKLERHPDVLRVQLDILLHAISPQPRTQPQLAESVPLIQANQVHALGITGSGVRIAILDTGIDTDHPDFSTVTPGDRIVAQNCFLTGASCPSPPNVAEDGNGHGTHVSGIAASDGSVSSVGVAPAAQLVAVKVLRDNGSGYLSDTVAALDWIYNNNASLNVKVVNMSLGSSTLYTPPCDSAYPAMTTAINNLRAIGVISFAASGNNSNATQMSLPACITSAVSVGAVYDANVGGISWGIPVVCTDPTTAADQVVCITNGVPDLQAPGALITSSVNGGGTATYGGTSMASPHAAGTAALLLQAKPALTPDQIETLLVTTGVPVTDPKNGQTRPRINAFAAVSAALSSCTATGAIFRIERTTGNVCADGSFNSGGADVAEYVRVSEAVEPGDVLELDPTKPGHYRKARGAYSTLVAGVVSTQPGVILGVRPNPLAPFPTREGGQAPGFAWTVHRAAIGGTPNSPDAVWSPPTLGEGLGERSTALLALIGRVPVRATTENGPIRPGDLLTSSSKPGYAMRCDEARKCEGAIIGKALEALDGSDGVILMLVMK
uniref:Peptidase S8/S53 n=2 Tax=Candidatus Bipolaricaulota TaxID=67810 RepID=H5SG92_9BACT|nr:peptidase S8/S53 [uncultured Acetothermia bacterium]BAL60219.1 peptidase S8/S53 [Candidatus Acetothermum autotrophicum]